MVQANDVEGRPRSGRRSAGKEERSPLVSNSGRDKGQPSSYGECISKADSIAASTSQQCRFLMLGQVNAVIRDGANVSSLKSSFIRVECSAILLTSFTMYASSIVQLSDCVVSPLR